jgi:amino acid transporter
MPPDTHLHRRIGLGLLTAYGVGVMVGAGIYVLVGAVAAEVGQQAWLAFVLAGLIAAPTALSFAELAARIPEAGGAAAYVRVGLSSPAVSMAVGLAVIAAGTVSAAAVLQGGVGYLMGVLPIPETLGLVAIGGLLTLIAVWGVVESLSFAAILTAIEVAGLILIVAAGFIADPIPPSEAAAGLPPIGALAILGAAALAFFAFIGFEDMVNLAEETRNPTRTMPLAILIAMGLVSLIYALVAYAATRAVAPAELSQSAQPLALVWQAGFGQGVAILSLIAVAAALNGVLAQIVMAARVLYGLGRSSAVFKPFATAHPRFGTPARGTLAVGAAVILAALLLPVATLAEIAASLLLAVFILVNVVLLRVKSRTPRAAFHVPALVPVLGALVSAAALILSFVVG